MIASDWVSVTRRDREHDAGDQVVRAASPRTLAGAPGPVSRHWPAFPSTVETGAWIAVCWWWGSPWSTSCRR